MMAYLRVSDKRILAIHPIWPWRVVMLATQTLPSKRVPEYRPLTRGHFDAKTTIIKEQVTTIKYLDDEVNAGNLELIDLKDLVWIHPHLLKVFKVYLKTKK